MATVSEIAKSAPAKASKPVSKPSRIVHQVTSTFDKSQWPSTKPNDSQVIVSLLQTLLEPIGQHKSTYITPSKGKRDRKRKRNADGGEAIARESTDNDIPQRPKIASFIATGYNSTLRSLDMISDSLISAVFVTGNPEWPPYAQLPIICGLKAQQTRHEIRLVLLDRKVEAVLCAALGIPRVGVLGIRADAPGAQSLLEIVTETVPPIKAPWQDELDQLTQGKWLGANIEVVKPLVHATER